jgi:hypothetical protein
MEILMLGSLSPISHLFALPTLGFSSSLIATQEPTAIPSRKLVSHQDK